MARTTTKDGLWVETTGSKAEIGVTKATLGGKKLTKIETLGKGARIGQGDALVLLTLGKKEEVEMVSPVKGRISEIRPELARAVTAVTAVADDPDRAWILRIELAQAAEDEDEDDDEDDFEDEGLDDDDDE